MEPGSEPALNETLQPEGPVEPVQSGYADLGPISPELALVDAALAERARRLLPEPRERPRSAKRPASGPDPKARPAHESKVDQAPARRRRTRWSRMLLLAVLIFVVGAFSGAFLGENRPAPQGVPLELKAGESAATAGSGGGTQPARQQTSTGAGKPRQSSSDAKQPRSPAAGTAKSELREPAHVITWAPNVLGVTANVDHTGVRLVWERPSNSDHIAVFRTSGAQRAAVVVFRASGTSYRDSSARACTEYRYTIVNYDRNGHRSTGVPTSVVTQGCT